MKVLVIGGAGYIGSHVVWDLADKGHTVHVLDNLSTGYRENVPADVSFIQGDILDKETLDKAMKNMDAVVLLAAKKAVGESMKNPVLYAENNLVGTINVLNAMHKHGVRFVIFSSSAAVYGVPDKDILDETSPLNPINFYGFTKLEIERLLEWYSKLTDIRFVALRYFNAVGYDVKGRVKGQEKNAQNLLPVVMETLIGKRPKMQVFGDSYPTPDGTCIRDYIHVNDLADAHTRSLMYLAENQTSQIFNLGTGKGLSVLEILTAVESVTGKKVAWEFAPPRPGDPAILRASSEKAKEILGWVPTHSDVQTIVQSTWQIYKP